MSGPLIFDIERFSCKDGPGIRTVVFFKGCNLSCRWCHNPESICREPELLYNAQRCVACGKCAEACPQMAHSFEKERHGFDPTRCLHCLQCTQVCFSGALRKVGRTMTTEQILEEVLADKALYDRSGGGVTLTGGEVMCQWPAVRTLLMACREAGIHTAIETNLSFPWETYEQILPWTDWLFADIKLLSSHAHKFWTGADNRVILENLERLKSGSIPFAIRTPVIPGVNDDIGTITAIAQRLRNAPALRYYELLSYNPLGGGKGTLVRPTRVREFPLADPGKDSALAEAASALVPTKLNGKEVIPHES